MNKQVAMGILLLALSPIRTAVAANPKAATQAKPDQKPTFAMVLDRSLTNVEQEVVPAAEAMPEDKFSFVPTQGEFKGVRTFAQQVKHIAAVNYLIAGAILGEKPPVNLGGEDGPDNITSKADVVKFLRDSFTYLHKAATSIDENNVLGQVPAPFGSLRPDGGISAHEQHHSPGEPAAEVVSHVWPLPFIATQATHPGVFRYRRRSRLGAAVQHRSNPNRVRHPAGCSGAREACLIDAMGLGPELGKGCNHWSSHDQCACGD